ncbi:DNA polymerase III subunit delta [Thermosulfuriphilus sp.]
MPTFKGERWGRLLELARQGRIAPVYLFTGDEALCRLRQRELSRQLLGQGLTFKEITQEEDLWAEFSAGSLLGLKHLLRLEFPLSPEAQRQLGQMILAGAGQDKSLIIYLQDPEASLLKAAEKKGALISLSAPRRGRRPDQRLLWREEALRIATSLGKTIEPEALELLYQRIGEDLFALSTEMEKLALATDSQTISRDLVDELTPIIKEESLLGVGEAICAGRLEEALKTISRLLERGGLPPLKILAALATYLRRLIQAACLLQEGLLRPPLGSYPVFVKEVFPALKKNLEGFPDLKGLHPYALYRLLEQARGQDLDSLTEVYLLLPETDLALKGLSSLGHLRLENFVVIWAQKVGGRAR